MKPVGHDAHESRVPEGPSPDPTRIDPTTGAKTIDASLVPGDSTTKFTCPHAGGAKSWLPSSYNPRTRMP